MASAEGPTVQAPGHAAASVPALLVMLSGSGRTLVNLCEEINAGRLRARVALVVASRDCPGVERAGERSIPVIIERGELPAERLAALASSCDAALVVLAGYLKKVHIPRELEHKVVNIHPALLPSFGGQGMYGHHVHEAVLAHGCKVSGCTVHLCDGHYDRGPILVQRTCPVLEGDTPDTLARRVFAEECIAYPHAIAMLLEGRVNVRAASTGARAEIMPAR